MIRMIVSAQRARIEISRIDHAKCQEAATRFWQTRKDENGEDYATAQSICWLFCWGKTGLNSRKASTQARAAFNTIFDCSYNWLSRRLDHELARELRYQEGDAEDTFYSSIGLL